MPGMDPIPVEALLEDYPGPTRAIANRLRDVVRLAFPDVLEVVRTGWRIVGYDVPNGRRTTYFAWIMPQREHVHLGFVHGVSMRDPERLLDGDARLARWTTFTSVEEIDPAPLVALVREAARVSCLPRRARIGALLDEEMAARVALPTPGSTAPRG